MDDRNLFGDDERQYHDDYTEEIFNDGYYEDIRDNFKGHDIERYIEETVERELENRFRKNKMANFAKFTLGIFLTATLSSGVTSMYFKNRNTKSDIKTGNSTEAVTINTSNDVNVEKAVAKKATNSVVGISTVAVTEDMFSRQLQVQGIGSGVIVSKDGYIVTNNHVVDPSSARDTTVLLNDGTKLKARVLWADKTLDLAVIKVDPNGVDLEPIEIANSDEIEVGEKSIAIGSPLGLNLQSTLTSGYISGKDRTISLQDGSTMEGLLQTDASINPGNSGGALLNSKGELIGINTAKAGGSDGIGFAIPINIAKPILDQIVKNGKFEMVVLGIKGLDVSRYNAISGEKLDLDGGVYVHEAVSGYPASNGGIKSGDIIVKIGDKKINSNSNIKTTLLNYRPGDSTTVEVIRGGKSKELKVTFDKVN